VRQINVLATQRLASAAAKAGIRDFIFMSSIKAVAERSGPAPLTEAANPAPEDCYGLAKLAAERRLQRVHRNEPAMRVVVLRPPLVYGPGVGANFGALLRLVARGLPLPLASIRNRRSLLYVGNLVAAVLRCLQRGDVPSGTFHLSDGASVSTPDLVRAIARAQGKSARLFPVPVRLLAIGARAVGRRVHAARLLGSLEVSNEQFCRSFDWQPPYTLAQGLQATVDDFAQRATGRRP
jgi:nucleoside-diphosphate-sugar epimerase